MREDVLYHCLATPIAVRVSEQANAYGDPKQAHCEFIAGLHPVRPLRKIDPILTRFADRGIRDGIKLVTGHNR